MKNQGFTHKSASLAHGKDTCGTGPEIEVKLTPVVRNAKPSNLVILSIIYINLNIFGQIRVHHKRLAQLSSPVSPYSSSAIFKEESSFFGWPSSS
jgi:hypothetical protein